MKSTSTLIHVEDPPQFGQLSLDWEAMKTYRSQCAIRWLMNWEYPFLNFTI